MNYFNKAVAVTSTLAVLAFATFAVSPVLANSPGQIGGGQIYKIQNLTQKVVFANPASANKCDVLGYSAMLHNSGYGSLSSIVVQVSLPASAGLTNVSTLTATSTNGNPLSTSATATLNLTTSQSVSYISGTTQLLDAKGNLIKNLPDGITASGVNIGNLSGSTTEFINFEAKVSCPVIPPVIPPVVPPVLVNTGPGAVVGLFAVATIVGAVAHRLFGGRFARSTK